MRLRYGREVTPEPCPDRSKNGSLDVQICFRGRIDSVFVKLCTLHSSGSDCNALETGRTAVPPSREAEARPANVSRPLAVGLLPWQRGTHQQTDATLPSQLLFYISPWHACAFAVPPRTLLTPASMSECFALARTMMPVTMQLRAAPLPQMATPPLLHAREFLPYTITKDGLCSLLLVIYIL